MSSPCFDDNPDRPTLTVTATVVGNLTSSQALGVIVHNATVGGNVEQHGGGGGFDCDPSGVFAVFGSPVFSTYEDSSVGGNVDISNVTSCWMGTARVDIGGNASYVGNQVADPDAIEIVSNHIHGNLSCQGNSMVWDSGDPGAASSRARRSRTRSTAGGADSASSRARCRTAARSAPAPSRKTHGHSP